MEQIIYLDGEYVPKSQAKVSVFDHGVLYGDGVFEGIRSYGGNVFRLMEHLERLYDSAKVIMLPIRETREEMAHIVCETIRRNNLTDSYIRLVVTRGVGDLGISPLTCPRPTTFCIAGQIAMFPQELYRDGLAIITASTRRVTPDAFSPRVKSLNYLNNVLAKLEAHHAGVRDALMLDHQGYIVEATAANFFAVKKGELFTPPVHQGSLRGITRDAVIELAKAAGIAVHEERLTLYEAYTADEVFLTGTGAEMIPVVDIDKRIIGTGKPGPVFQDLLPRFRKLVLTDGVRI
jgi:branched-chain amino acid aminotransferase